MNTNIERIAPYAPFGCVITVIRRFRERGLSETLTVQEITRVGVSEGNASRTLQALKFLKLVDEDGHRTQIFDRLGQVSTKEYTEAFGEIIKKAYRDVFTIVDPANATDVEINDAFRHYQPQAQRGRMVTLFIGLCQEVGLVAGGPPETRKRLKTTMVGKPSMTLHSANSLKSQAETLYTVGTTGAVNCNFAIARQEYVLLQELLQQLPADKRWTKERRDRWLQAFTANIDFLIDIDALD